MPPIFQSNMKRFQQGAIHILEGIIIGILLVSCGLPILDSLTALIMTIIEAGKGYFGTIVAKYNAKMVESVNPPERSTPTIGFSIPKEEYYDEE